MRTERIVEESVEMRSACAEGTGRNPGEYALGAMVCPRAGGRSAPEAQELLEQIVASENMRKAWKRVKRNKGAPGVDGRTIDETADLLRQYWEEIKERLMDGTYRPQPALRVEIPKAGGGMRKLGVPTVLDRLIQQAVHQILSPLFEPGFSETSYGFRPGRSAHDAVLKARAYQRDGKRWVVDMDLKAFFDEVDHDILMGRARRKVKDRRVTRLINLYLKAGVLSSDGENATEKGTPQGGPLSPLLSNILLDDLDKELERRGHCFCRYADDCNIYVRSRRSGERVLKSVSRYVEWKLKLKVNVEKSAVDRPWKRSFLGYSFTHHRSPKIRVPAKSVKRFRQALKELFRLGRGRTLRRFINETLNPVLRGWINYFRLSEVKGFAEELDGWVRRRLRLILWRQWKRWRTRYKRLVARGLAETRARKSASNGRGAWWNSGASHMNDAFRKKYFNQLGLVNLLETLPRNRIA
ncbi:group II intron reverse transcriptase/maturase [Pontiellaceae bacterium B12227]|nr:group II intron reverse transcriptase/maturase [Pontiellaceae bacterium B12227]